MAVVDDIDLVAPALDQLTGIGWVPAPEPGDEEDRRRSWCSPSVAHRTHHLHVVEERSPGWPRWLAFRDLLRHDRTSREEYAVLKRGLAAEDDRDRARYRSGKAAFIQARC